MGKNEITCAPKVYTEDSLYQEISKYTGQAFIICQFLSLKIECWCMKLYIYNLYLFRGLKSFLANGNFFQFMMCIKTLHLAQK